MEEQATLEVCWSLLTLDAEVCSHLKSDARLGTSSQLGAASSAVPQGRVVASMYLSILVELC